jgi:hypothetical protein
MCDVLFPTISSNSLEYGLGVYQTRNYDCMMDPSVTGADKPPLWLCMCFTRTYFHGEGIVRSRNANGIDIKKYYMVGYP